MNSVEVDLAFCKELMIGRVLMLKVMFLLQACLWHWRVESPNRTKRMDSG